MSATPVPPGPGRVLVFGARGYVGANLVARLVREGAVIRATARKVEQLHARGWTGVEIVEADALVPATLPAALQGVDTAYYLVQAMGADESIGALDVHAAQNFARAASDAGVRCIVYPGRLVPGDADSPHLLSRAEVGSELRKGPVPVIELRARLIIGLSQRARRVR